MIQFSGSTIIELAQDTAMQSRIAMNCKRVFMYSYFSSLVVAFTVVVIWLTVLFNDPSLSQSQRRTSPPDIMELIFLVVTTLPSVLTCLLFSFFYCSVFKVYEVFKLWPAILFGAISGSVYNAMTAIIVIEHFFNW